MNKRDFLKLLEKELSVLERDEQKEILDFYEERFHTGVNYEGKTEEEVIAELEHPRIIARNVLEEYGVSRKFVKTKEERYGNINSMNVILLICFDLFIVSWLIPTLFSVVVSVFAVMFTWVSTIPLMGAGRTIVDQYLFAFLTSGYILVFMFGLVVLEMFIWSCKKTIVLHLNVFKAKNREKFIKRASSFSVDKFFKNHKGLRALKNLLLIGSIIGVAISGFWLLTYSDVVRDQYTGELQTTTYNLDVTEDVDNMDSWDITIDLSDYDVDVRIVEEDTITVTHKYYDLDNFTYDLNDSRNEILLEEDADYTINWGFTDIFKLLSGKQEVIVYVPQDLLLDNVMISTVSGDINVKDFNSNTASITATSGRLNIHNLNVASDLDASTVSGKLEISNIVSTELGSLTAFSTSGSINVNNVEFATYEIGTTSGNVNLDNFNVTNQDGEEIEVDVVSGNVDLYNVYVKEIKLDTVSGNISYDNDDDTYKCDSIEADSVSGTTHINVLFE